MRLNLLNCIEIETVRRAIIREYRAMLKMIKRVAVVVVIGRGWVVGGSFGLIDDK